MQKLPFTAKSPYVPSAQFLPDGGRAHPDPAQVAMLIERIRAAKRPVVLGGRGAVRSEARAAVEALADRCGAVLATTLPARGLFDQHPFSLGVAGGYASNLNREILGRADLVIAVGASLSYYTVDGGNMFPQAFVAQIDDAPRGLRDGMSAADLYIRADARASVEILTAELDRMLGPGKPTAAAIRTNELAHRIANDPADTVAFDIAPGLLDPRAAISALDGVIPPDWDIVSGSGHQSYFNSQMRNRMPERFTAIREFGAIGNGLAFAMGVAAARRLGRESRVVLIEGDGSLLMHIQELETLKRHGLRILICVLNDGAYGAEIHKNARRRHRRFRRDLRSPGVRVDCARIRSARRRSARSGCGAQALRGFRTPGRDGSVEHPDLRSGHRAQHAQDDRSRTWGDVAIGE
jgi:thiamine pyrophosphate-dependent acetolactate synthase large subunit-like protein